MDPLFEESCMCTFCNEVLYLLILVLVASLETRRVMEDKFLVALKDHLIIDIMDSTLWKVRWIAKIPR